MNTWDGCSRWISLDSSWRTASASSFVGLVIDAAGSESIHAIVVGSALASLIPLFIWAQIVHSLEKRESRAPAVAPELAAGG